jgi:hypothetical protein
MRWLADGASTGELAGAMAWSVLGLTLGGSSLLYLLIQRGAATTVTSLMYLVPPTTALMAWALFGEPITPLIVAGMALTAVGVSLVVRGVMCAARWGRFANPAIRRVGSRSDPTESAFTDARKLRLPGLAAKALRQEIHQQLDPLRRRRRVRRQPVDVRVHHRVAGQHPHQFAAGQRAAMSHRLRSMMPWPARHQSRTSSPELLESRPPTRTRASERSRSRCSRQTSNCSFSRTTRQSCAASSSTLAGVPRRRR